MKSHSSKKESKKENRKEEKLAEKKKQEESLVNETLYIEGNLPFRDFDESTGVFIMDDGTLCDCVEIVSKDLISISDDQLMRDRLSFDRLFKTYAGDIKIVSFAFPADVRRPREYFEYKIKMTENPAKRKRLEEELENIKGVGRNFPARSYLLFFFARNPAEYQNNRIAVITSLNRGGSPLVRELENDRKIAYVRQLLNKNMTGE